MNICFYATTIKAYQRRCYVKSLNVQKSPTKKFTPTCAVLSNKFIKRNFMGYYPVDSKRACRRP